MATFSTEDGHQSCLLNRMFEIKALDRVIPTLPSGLHTIFASAPAGNNTTVDCASITSTQLPDTVEMRDALEEATKEFEDDVGHAA